VKFQFVDAEKANFPVAALCRAMSVKRKSYYAWRKRPQCARVQQDQALVLKIKAAFKRSRDTYGSPRVHAALVASGCTVGLNRVARLMRENELSVRPRRGFRCTTTQRDPAHQVAPNVLERDFSASQPNEKWVTDVTFVPTDEGWLYLATLLDLYNREVVGWAMDGNNDQNLTARALTMALETHNPPEGLVHHSDRGSTYTAHDYRDMLKDNGIKCSMSRKGDCWDNAVAESFFSSLKKDLVHRMHFKTRRQAAVAIFEYLEVFYNRIRLHSTLGYKTPVEYRLINTTPVTTA
jgi:transposase InsO family protein